MLIRVKPDKGLRYYRQIGVRAAAVAISLWLVSEKIRQRNGDPNQIPCQQGLIGKL
jgi:hypothetical protein